MPSFRTVCRSCKDRSNRMASAPGALAQLRCKACGAQNLFRDARGPAAQVVERLDNGAMPHPLERLADAERLHRERAAKADPLAGGAEFELPESLK